jgi:hypothetical protein
MSTKTIYKRIALVAVAGMVSGLVSVAPASATDEVINTTVSVSDTGDGTATATANGIVGGQITFTFGDSKATTDYTVTTDGKSVIQSATTSEAANASAPTSIGTNFSGGISWSEPSAGETLTVKATAAAAGTSTITVSKIGANSARVNLATLTITWVAATSTDLASVATYLRATNTCDSTVTASNVSSMNYTGSTLYLCVAAKNAAPAAYTQNTASVAVIGNGTALIGGAAVNSTTTSSGYAVFTITSSGISGTATFNVSVSATGQDAVTTVTKTASASLPVTGHFTSITLANEKSSIATGGDTGVLSYTGNDKDGNLAIVNLTTGANWYVESDKGTTAVSSTNKNNSSATLGNEAADTIQRTTGSAAADTGRVDVTAATAYEKLTIWVEKTNGLGVKVTSNKVVVYISTAVAKSAAISAVDGTVSGSQKIRVSYLSDPATTKNAYPIIDGTELVTLAVTAGTLTAATAELDETGAAVFTYYGPQLGGEATFNASLSNSTVVATKTIKLSGDSITTLINSLIAKINALSKLVAKIQKKVRA